MNKIITITLLFLVALALGITVAYFLKLPPAVMIVEAIADKFRTAAGDLNLTSIASYASIGTAAVSAVGWIKSHQDKLATQAQATQKAITDQNTITELATQNSTIANLKKEAESKLTDATSQVDSLKGQLETKTALIGQKEEEIKNLTTQIETLQQLVKTTPILESENIIVK